MKKHVVDTRGLLPVGDMLFGTLPAWESKEQWRQAYSKTTDHLQRVIGVVFRNITHDPTVATITSQGAIMTMTTRDSQLNDEFLAVILKGTGKESTIFKMLQERLLPVGIILHSFGYSRKRNELKFKMSINSFYLQQ